MLLAAFIFIASLVGLLLASDWFVDSSERIGLSLGISPFVIGVTIVAFGTSLPELASSVVAVLNSEAAIVTGNVIGSNVANVCLVLGVVAVVAGGIKMEFKVLDIDVPILLVSAIMTWTVTRDGLISAPEGLVLLVLLVLFLVNSFRSHGREDGVRVAAGWRAYGLLLVGALGVYFGAKYMVYGIQELSTELGLSSGAIAMSAVALGTSLPEVIVSVAAARKGKPGIAVGNVLGSNVFNSYAVLGIPSLIGELSVPIEEISFSLYFMLAITVLFCFLATAQNVSRWEGATLIALYGVFMLELFVA